MASKTEDVFNDLADGDLTLEHLGYQQGWIAEGRPEQQR